MNRLSFARVTGLVSVVWASLFFFMMAGKIVAVKLTVDPVVGVVLRGIIPAVVAIVVATTLFARAAGTRDVAIKSYLADVGLRLPRSRQWLVVLVAMLPLLAAYAVIFCVIRVPMETQPPSLHGCSSSP